MGKKIVIASGLLAAASWFGAKYLLILMHASQLADFALYACFPFFVAVFVLSLFIVRVRRASARTRSSFFVMRIVVLTSVAIFLIAVFWPRSYGTPPTVTRPGMKYWDLQTGSRIAYTQVPAKGNKKTSPLIYLHGGPGGAIGEGNIQGLAWLASEGYDIYLYDQVGGGSSSRLRNIRDYSTERQVRDLDAIVRQIGARKVILFGHSWGAILAVLYAADHPECVDRIIVTGPGPIFPVRPGIANERAPDSLQLKKPFYSNRQGNEEANNVRTRAMEFFATHFGLKIASDREADDFAGYLNALLERSTVADTSKIGPIRPIPGVGYYAGVMTFYSRQTTPDPRPKLHNTAIPLLVVKGQYDNQEWGFTHEYLELFPDHRLVVVPNAGHSIGREQPALLDSAIWHFLENVD
jgi:proline iminopeptidase